MGSVAGLPLRVLILASCATSAFAKDKAEWLVQSVTEVDYGNLNGDKDLKRPREGVQIGQQFIINKRLDDGIKLTLQAGDTWKERFDDKSEVGITNFGAAVDFGKLKLGADFDFHRLADDDHNARLSLDYQLGKVLGDSVVFRANYVKGESDPNKETAELEFDGKDCRIILGGGQIYGNGQKINGERIAAQKEVYAIFVVERGRWEASLGAFYNNYDEPVGKFAARERIEGRVKWHVTDELALKSLVIVNEAGMERFRSAVEWNPKNSRYEISAGVGVYKRLDENGYAGMGDVQMSCAIGKK